MEITVRRTGGFAGVNEALGPVDTGDLDAQSAGELESVVLDMGFFDLPSSFPSGSGADVYEFTATVVDGERCHSTSWDDLSDRPPGLDQLIELLLAAGATWEQGALPMPAAPNPLFQRWTHSREEDTDDVEVYRPEGFAFPPSFGRDGFEIRPDGTFMRRAIGPADGTVEVPGRWMAQVVVATFDDPTVDQSTLTLLSYDQDRLELQRRPGGDQEPSDRLCRDWTAYLDLQPPGPAVLRVRGVCTFPTAGYVVGLRRHEPQGFNPRDLLLELVVTEPTGPVADVITEVEVRYEEESQQGAFDTVTILPDVAQVPVEEVH